MKRRPRGRPPITPGEPSAVLSVRVTSHQYDALARRALQSQRSIAAVTRAILRKQFRTEK